MGVSRWHSPGVALKVKARKLKYPAKIQIAQASESRVRFWSDRHELNSFSRGREFTQCCC